MIKMKQTFE